MKNVVGAMIILAAVGCDVQDETRRPDEDPKGRIFGGAKSITDDSVGGLLTSCGNGEGSFCTGTLIGPNVVLTAAHCVHDPDAGIDLADCSSKFAINSTLSSDYVAAQQVILHPGWTPEQIATRQYETDLAIVKLAEFPLGAQTAVFSSDAVQDGSSIRIVGLGDNDAGVFGRQTALTEVEGGDNETFFYSLAGGGASCEYGDAGGPSLLDVGGQDRIVGVHVGSTGCDDPQATPDAVVSLDVRVEPHLPWIVSVTQGELGCAGVDAQGYCAGDHVVYCAAGVLHSLDCAGPGTEDQTCTYDYDASRYGCGDDPGPEQPEPDPEPLPPAGPGDGPAPTAPGCGDLDYQGECKGQTLVWCENATIMTADCASSGRTCGWQDDAIGNNCLPPAGACGDLDYHGTCSGGTLSWCEGGAVQTYDCAGAGMGCGWQDDAVGNNCV